jgi:hypothetical protein
MVNQLSDIFQQLFQPQPPGQGPGQEGSHGHLQNLQPYRVLLKPEPELLQLRESILHRKAAQRKIEDAGGQLDQALQDAVYPAGEVMSTLKTPMIQICAFLHIFLDEPGERS